MAGLLACLGSNRQHRDLQWMEAMGMTTIPTLLDLIDVYAEARHTCGDSTYNATTKAARAAVIAALAAPADALAEPEAWLWKFPDGEEEVVFVSPERLKAGVLDADEMPSSITPLYTAPPATQLQQAVAREREELCQKLSKEIEALRYHCGDATKREIAERCLLDAIDTIRAN